MDVETKYALLKENIKNYGKIAVAYSGGLDSTFLLKVTLYHFFKIFRRIVVIIAKKRYCQE